MRILLSPVAYRTGSTAGAVSQYGFTLIEMLIAVAVLAALTALAAPYLKAPTTEKLHEASAAIADMYRYARDKSIGTGQRRAVMVETKNGEVLFAVLTEG
ncbi:MAG: prepilin-type N-terminal cleavage/methylation domain-containing protein, partial [Gammaproteobacteria bacterium]|nr:prepilin-type N-terminal cleavage/methylation domain-containing protein [Gammaproteobacteria bacterium]